MDRRPWSVGKQCVERRISGGPASRVGKPENTTIRSIGVHDCRYFKVACQGGPKMHEFVVEVGGGFRHLAHRCRNKPGLCRGGLRLHDDAHYEDRQPKSARDHQPLALAYEYTTDHRGSSIQCHLTM